MLAFRAPHNRASTGSRPTPERHRWAGFGFDLTASAVSSAARRLVMLRLGERFAFRFGSQPVENLPQHVNAGREWIAIVLKDFVKLADQSFPLAWREGDCPFGTSGSFASESSRCILP